MTTLKGAEGKARTAERQAMPWVERLARLGYAAKGIVYIILGLLAMQAALGSGNPRVDQTTAFQKILQQPFGQFLLAIVAVGLAGYALWRLIQALADPEHEGQRQGGAMRRVGYAISAVSYGILCYIAYKMDTGRGGAQQNPADFTAGLMRQPAGRWLVLLAGLAVLVAGITQIAMAYQSRFEKRFKTQELSAQQKRQVVLLGRIGYAAKGLVLAIVGWFLVQAAVQYSPQKAAGLGDALARLQAQPYGVFVVAVIALGLLAYGLYALFLSRFRGIQAT